MGKLLAGMLLVLVGSFGVVSVAGAAEIPPTEECSKLNKQLTADYFESLGGKWSTKAVKRADRKFAEALAEADCITDADSVINEKKAKPHTEQCVAAAQAAGAFWAPHTAGLTKEIRAGERALKPLRKRSTRLTKRIKQLKARGASKQRIRALIRTRKAISRKKQQVAKPHTKRIRQIIAPQAHDTSLILYELMSLRCISLDYLVDIMLEEITRKKHRGPVYRVMRNHMGLVFMSGLYVLIKHGDSGAGSASISGAGSDLTAGQTDALRLPMISVP